MGGGRQFLYPKWVWSPAGGWWANPTHWKRNSMIYGAFVVGAVCWTWQVSKAGTVGSINFISSRSVLNLIFFF
jgi:hypothetical protein